ncbi:MAG: hypothetical protein NC336_09270 [Clostridium sp.]|nr:hypothetical protein [Clostridium sp.]
MKPTILAALAAALMAAPTASAFDAKTTPREGDRVLYTPVTMLSPDTVSDRLWDFRDAEAAGPAAEFRYIQYGDTLFSEFRPGIRYDYRRQNDTLLLVRAETHGARVDFRDGAIPYAFAGPLGSSLRETGRQYMCDSLRGEGRAEFVRVMTGTVLLPGDMALDGVTLYRREAVTERYRPDLVERGSREVPDSLKWHHRETLYTWEHPALRYPLAETRVVVDSVAGAGVIYAGYQSWRSLPSDHPAEIVKNAPEPLLMAVGAGKGYSLLTGDGSGAAAPTEVDIAADGEGVSVRGIAPVSADASTFEFLLTDVAGRVYASLPSRRYEPGAEFSIAVPCQLPPGTYVVHFRTPTADHTEKFTTTVR